MSNTNKSLAALPGNSDHVFNTMLAFGRRVLDLVNKAK